MTSISVSYTHLKNQITLNSISAIFLLFHHCCFFINNNYLLILYTNNKINQPLFLNFLMSLEIFHYKVARNIKSCYTMKVAIKLIKYDYFIRRSIEVVITSCTRNAVYLSLIHISWNRKHNGKSS